MPLFMKVPEFTAVNVSLTYKKKEHSIPALILWINNTLQTKITCLDEMFTGALYCQIIHKLFPNCIDLTKVKFAAWLIVDRIHNFKLLQQAFTRLRITQPMAVQKMVEGSVKETFEFLQWFRCFYDANNKNNSYNPLVARNWQEPISKMPTKVERMRSRSMNIKYPRKNSQPRRSWSSTSVSGLSPETLRAVIAKLRNQCVACYDSLSNIDEICRQTKSLKAAIMIRKEISDVLKLEPRTLEPDFKTNDTSDL